MKTEDKSNLKNSEVSDNLKEPKAYKYAKFKKRYWTFVLYDDSAPTDWREILQRTGLEICISPKHDKDKNPDGTLKKPHYHILLCYEGPTTGNNVKNLVCGELSQPIPLPVDSVKGLYRYFYHRDNPEKYQYSESDIVTLNGFSIYNYADLSAADKGRIKLELVKFIQEKEIMEYSDFMDAIVAIDKPDYFTIASCNTIFFNSYISSRRNKFKDELNKKYYYIDKETGEIIDNKTENEEA